MDRPGRSSAANSRANLSNLFGSAASGDGTTRALAYTAPKEPTKVSSSTRQPKPAARDHPDDESAPATPRADAGGTTNEAAGGGGKPPDSSRQQQQPGTAPAVQSETKYAYAGQTRLYQLKNGAYAPAAATEQLCGVVILAKTPGPSYQLLVYDAAKRPVLAAPIAELFAHNAAVTPQRDEYVAFAARGAAYSAHVAGGAFAFLRAVNACRAHALAAADAEPKRTPFWCDLAFVASAQAGDDESGTSSVRARIRSFDLGGPTTSNWVVLPTSFAAAIDDREAEVAVVADRQSKEDYASIDEAVARALVGAAPGAKRGVLALGCWVEVDVLEKVVKQQRLMVDDAPQPASAAQAAEPLERMEPPPAVSSPPAAPEEAPKSSLRPRSIAERMAGLSAAGGAIPIGGLVAKPAEAPPPVAAPVAVAEVPAAAAPVRLPHAQDHVAPTAACETPAAPQDPPKEQDISGGIVSTPARSSAPARDVVVSTPRVVLPQQHQVVAAPVSSSSLDAAATTSDAFRVALQSHATLVALEASVSRLHDKVDAMDSTQNNRRQSAPLDDLPQPAELAALEARLSEVLRDYGARRAKERERDASRDELREKLDAMREKNAQLVAEKIEVMEKHAAIVAARASSSTDARELRADLEAAVAARDSATAAVDVARREASEAAEGAARAHDAWRAEKSALETRATEAEKRAAAAADELREARAASAAFELRAATAEKARDEALAGSAAAKEEGPPSPPRGESTSATTQTDGDDASSSPATPPAPGIDDPQARDKLVKAIMNDTYKHLYAKLVTSRAHNAAENTTNGDGSSDAVPVAEIGRTLKSVLKAVTAHYLQPPPAAPDHQPQQASA